ncbi:MAG: LPS assembly lipoprotein LptE [Salibacteraceae bacterium]
MKNLFIILAVSFALYSCSASYSFTGTSTGDAKTISIQTVSNRAPLTPPTYPQSFTEDLKENFLRQTNLDLIKSDGDLQISGYIKRYTSGPIATTGNETTSQNRLRVSVQITFVNKLDASQNFDRSFERFEDYSSAVSLSSIQDQLLTNITEQLAQDIIQASIGNW